MKNPTNIDQAVQDLVHWLEVSHNQLKGSDHSKHKVMCVNDATQCECDMCDGDETDVNDCNGDAHVARTRANPGKGNPCAHSGAVDNRNMPPRQKQDVLPQPSPNMNQKDDSGPISGKQFQALIDKVETLEKLCTQQPTPAPKFRQPRPPRGTFGSRNFHPKQEVNGFPNQAKFLCFTAFAVGGKGTLLVNVIFL